MMSTLKPEVNQKDHIKGTAEASVTIVEFGDYQCPHCADAHPIIKKIQGVFGDKIRLVVRNFPLQESHQFAFRAAAAAEAAAAQHKFWEMHDAIFENQNRIGENLFDELAQTIGLDLDRFKKDSASNEIKEKIEDDFESGIRSGVNGTPSFFLNGTKFDGDASALYQKLEESEE